MFSRTSTRLFTLSKDNSENVKSQEVSTDTVESKVNLNSADADQDVTKEDSNMFVRLR